MIPRRPLPVPLFVMTLALLACTPGARRPANPPDAAATRFGPQLRAELARNDARNHFDVLIRTRRPCGAHERAVLQGLGVSIHGVQGDIVTAQASRAALMQLLTLDFVSYVEAASNVLPDVLPDRERLQ